MPHHRSRVRESVTSRLRAIRHLSDNHHDREICYQDYIIPATPGGSEYSYLWTPGNTTADKKLVEQTGLYSVQITDNETNCKAYDEVDIVLYPLFEDIQIIGAENRYICKGSSVMLEGVNVIGGTPPYSYFWDIWRADVGEFDETSPTPIVAPNEHARYKAIITDANNCSSLHNDFYHRYYVEVFQNKPIASFSSNQPYCEMQPICLNNTTNVFFSSNLSGYCEDWGGAEINIVKFNWNFGEDASPATYYYETCYSTYVGYENLTQPPCVNYSSYGNKIVSLTVTTPCGTDTYEHPIVVEHDNVLTRETITVCRSSLPMFPYYYAGEIFINPDDCNTQLTIENGESVTFTARDNIYIMKESSALYGSEVVFQINPCLTFGKGADSIVVKSNIPEENNLIGYETANIGNNDLYAFPNPFTDKTTINFLINTTADVEITIFNSLGMIIRTLKYESKQPGIYSFTTENIIIKSGLYFCNLKAGNYQKTIKIIKI